MLQPVAWLQYELPASFRASLAFSQEFQALSRLMPWLSRRSHMQYPFRLDHAVEAKDERVRTFQIMSSNPDATELQQV